MELTIVVIIKIKFQESALRKNTNSPREDVRLFFHEDYGWTKLLTVNYSLHQSGMPVDLCHEHNSVHCPFLCGKKNSRNFRG